MSKILLTTRGGKKLVHNGYGYVKRREHPQIRTISWCCDKKHSAKCNAGARTNLDFEDGGVVQVIGNHTHPPNPSKIKIVEARNILRQKAAESMEPINDVVREIFTQSGVETVVNLPKADTMRRSMRRYRSIAKKKDLSTSGISDGDGSFEITATARISDLNVGTVIEIDNGPNDNEVAAAVEEIVRDYPRPMPPPVLRRGLRTFGPVFQSQEKPPQHRETPIKNETTDLQSLKKTVLSLKKRVLENELKLQEEKRMAYEEKKQARIVKNAVMTKFDLALDEFRRFVAEQRMTIRGINTNTIPIDIPPGLEHILDE